MRIRASVRKWPSVHMAFDGAVLDLCNRAVSEKTPQIFLPPLPIEYVTVFSGRIDTPEVRCDLTDRHTDRPNYSNPRRTWLINMEFSFKLVVSKENNFK